MIELTLRSRCKVYLVVSDFIPLHICPCSDKTTSVGYPTHNNGGFEVLESPEEIRELIEKELIKQREIPNG
jgi:hypothetical protein